MKSTFCILLLTLLLTSAFIECADQIHRNNRKHRLNKKLHKLSKLQKERRRQRLIAKLKIPILEQKTRDANVQLDAQDGGNVVRTIPHTEATLNEPDVYAQWPALAGKTGVKIESMKLYWQDSGDIDGVALNQAISDIHSSSDIKAQKPSTLQAAWYFILQPAILTSQPTKVKHQVQELCVSSGGKFYRFGADRNAVSTLLDTWASKVRISYLGEAANCDLTSATWMHKETASNTNIKTRYNLIDETTLNPPKADFIQFIRVAHKYLTTFPNYNAVINCQHFGTNIYNLFTQKHLDFESVGLMKKHADKYVVKATDTEKGKLEWGIDLPLQKTAFKKMRKNQVKGKKVRRNRFSKNLRVQNKLRKLIKKH